MQALFGFRKNILFFALDRILSVLYNVCASQKTTQDIVIDKNERKYREEW